MNLEQYQSSLKNWLQQYPYAYEITYLVIIIMLAVLAYVITKKVLIRYVHKFTAKTKTDLDDILLNDKILRRISYIMPIIIIRQFSFFEPDPETKQLSELDAVLNNLLEGMIILFFILALSAFIDAAVIVIKKFPKFKDRPLKGYAQIVKIILYIISGIFILGIMTNQNPWGLFAGLGAMSAVLLLVFKDTILSFVASIQISTYDLVKVDDWIEMPALGVDGDVMDISLHTIKIRNFDKTITVIPTKSLVEKPFKNWRGMTDTGGRRIKRSIYIDLSSVRFVDEVMLERFKKFQLLNNYVESKSIEIQNDNTQKNIDTTEVINGRRMTNLGTFRQYLKEYLKNREDIHKGLTFLIRQLPPGSNGLPIEIYVFTTTTGWVEYEEIQADIFDHLLAVVSEFDLNIFQSPSGNDFQLLTKAESN